MNGTVRTGPARLRIAVFAALAVMPSEHSRADWSRQIVEAPLRNESAMLRTAPSGGLAAAFAGDAVYYAVLDPAPTSIEVVPSTGCTYRTVSLAYDPSGDPAIAFSQTEEFSGGPTALLLARFDGTEWSVEQIADAPFTGGFPGAGRTSLVFDASGSPMISFVAGTELRVALHDGSGWRIEVVEAVGMNGAFASMALSPSGEPSVSFYNEDEGGVLKFARRNSGVWTTETVDWFARTGTNTCLYFAPDGRPAISYTDPDDGLVRLSRFNGTSWVREMIDGNADAYSETSLAFDTAGRPVVSYVAASPPALKLARYDGASWQIEVLDDQGRVGWLTSMALDGSGNPGVAYLELLDDYQTDMFMEELRLARWNGSRWTLQVVNHAAEVGWHSSLVLDSLGHPVVSYQEFSNADLRLARWDGSRWRHETVDSAGYEGYGTSLSLDQAGNPVIAYGTWGPIAVKLARWTGSAWDLQIVDGASSNLRSLDMALGPTGRPVIAYSADNRYTVARWDGAAWDVDVLKSFSNGGSIDGRALSVAADSGGNFLVAYCDVSSLPEQTLALARWDGVSWSTETVEAAGTGVTSTSITLDSRGNPVIGFGSGGDLRMVRWDGIGWSAAVVDTVVGICWNPSLKLDAADNPSLTYVDSEGEIVRFAAWNGSGWRVEIVDSGAGDVSNDSTCSLALDAGGSPVISCFTGCTGDLFLATRHGPALLHRGVAGALAPGWKPSVLPLGPANDLHAAPFPLDVRVPGQALDPLPASEPLLFYRVLWPDGRPAGNTLRAVKTPAGTEIAF